MSVVLGAYRSPRFLALCIAILGSVASAEAWWTSPLRFYPSWLFAWMLVLGIVLGSMVIVLVHELTGGSWGYAIRRPLEAVLQTLPLVVLLAIPLAFGLRALYPWAVDPAGLDVPMLAHKRWFLNLPFFVVRAGGYFAIWMVLAHTLQQSWSRGETNAGIKADARLRSLAITGLILYALTITFASVDWIMSLSVTWYSTAFGFLMMTSEALGGYVFALMWSTYDGEIQRCVADIRARTQDLGNILLMFVMLWAYIAFTQFLIIWAADLPHEIGWYLERSSPAWTAVAVVIFGLQFVVPFVAMLFRSFKREPRRLMLLCGVVLAAHALEMLWLVAPGFRSGATWVDWTDGAALASIGGLWFALFLSRYATTRSIPASAPSLPRVAQHG